MSTDSRHAFIDALKAVISQLIVLHHLAFYGPMADHATPLAPELITWFSQYARFAVQSFLVMGGFLAAQSLARDGILIDRPFAQLIAKRYLKLVPPYLAALAFALAGAAIARQLMTHTSIPEAPTLSQFISHLLLLQGIFGFDGLSAGAWYVGIDFQLYTLLACTLWLARRNQRTARTTGHILVLCLIAASLFVFNRDSSWDNWAIYFVGAYGLGILSYWGVTPGRISLWFGLAVVIAGIGLAIDFRMRIAIAFAVAVALALTRFYPPFAGWPRSGLFAWLGKISYSVFLIHFPVCLLINGVFERYLAHVPAVQLCGVALAWAASIAAGAAFHRHIEAPTQRWFASSRAKA